jgi:molecular chaperone DnaK (HSP70)
LTAALQEFQAAVLDGQDAERIDSLRNQIAELADDDAVYLDDDIHITVAARGKAPAVLQRLTASQIAAYLAAHADEVGDPVEMMMSSLTELRELSASEAPDAGSAKKAGGEKSDSAGETASLIEDTAADVGYLVAGLDEAKAKELADKVAKWLKTNADAKEEEFSAKRKGLEESAKSLASNIHPMRVLNNWLEHQLATLVSNPQLPQAIDAMLAARQKRE